MVTKPIIADLPLLVPRRLRLAAQEARPEQQGSQRIGDPLGTAVVASAPVEVRPARELVAEPGSVPSINESSSLVVSEVARVPSPGKRPQDDPEAASSELKRRKGKGIVDESSPLRIGTEEGVAERQLALPGVGGAEETPRTYSINFDWEGPGLLVDDRDACARLFWLFHPGSVPKFGVQELEEAEMVGRSSKFLARAQALQNMAVANYERRLRDLRKEASGIDARLQWVRRSINDRITREVAKLSGDLAETSVVAEDAVVRADSAAAERDDVVRKLGDLSRELERVKGETCSYTERFSVLGSMRAKELAGEDARLRREVVAAEEAVQREFALRVQPVLDRVRHYLENQRRLDAANQLLTMYRSCEKCVELLRKEYGVEIPSDYDEELALDIAEAQQAVDAIPVVELDDVDIDIGMLDQHGTNAPLISPEDASELRDQSADDS